MTLPPEPAHPRPDPTPDVASLVAQADALTEQRRHREAEAMVMHALAGAPNDARLHEALSRAVLDRDRSLAIRAAQHAAALEPQAVRPLLNLVRVLTPPGDVFGLFHVEMAKEAIQRALLLAPHDPEVLAEHARIQAMLGRTGDALRTAQRAASDNPARTPKDLVTKDLTTMLVGSISWMIILGAGFGALSEESWGNALGSRPAAARIACAAATVLVALRVAIAWATYERFTGRPRSWLRTHFRAEEPIGYGWAQFVATMMVLLVVGIAAGIPHLAAAVAITTLLGQFAAAALRARRIARDLGD